MGRVPRQRPVHRVNCQPTAGRAVTWACAAAGRKLALHVSLQASVSPVLRRTVPLPAIVRASAGGRVAADETAASARLPTSTAAAIGLHTAEGCSRSGAWKSTGHLLGRVGWPGRRDTTARGCQRRRALSPSTRALRGRVDSSTARPITSSFDGSVVTPRAVRQRLRRIVAYREPSRLSHQAWRRAVLNVRCCELRFR